MSKSSAGNVVGVAALSDRRQRITENSFQDQMATVALNVTQQILANLDVEGQRTCNPGTRGYSSAIVLRGPTVIDNL